MKTFWLNLAKGAAKVAVWAAGHPDEAIAIISAAKSIKK